jgi:hypothetical protein
MYECTFSNSTEWYDINENTKLGAVSARRLLCWRQLTFKMRRKRRIHQRPVYSASVLLVLTALGQVRVLVDLQPGVETVDEDRLKGIVKKVCRACTRVTDACNAGQMDC